MITILPDELAVIRTTTPLALSPTNRGRSSITNTSREKQARPTMHAHKPAFTPPAPSRMTRRAALAAFAAVLGNAAITPLYAQEKKPKKGERGSKEAKGYQLCLSQCLYDCTTPKAGAAKERSECRVECKDECAVSREQL